MLIVAMVTVAILLTWNEAPYHFGESIFSFCLRRFGRVLYIAPHAPPNLLIETNLLGSARRSALICCLSTRISASNATRDRNRSLAIPKSIDTNLASGASIARFPVNCQHD
jgi:hypothetical protein